MGLAVETSRCAVGVPGNPRAGLRSQSSPSSRTTPISRTSSFPLAEATPPDKFSWHPQQGGRRSISAVYLYVASENIYYTTFLGAPAPPGFDFKTFEDSTTDKTMVIQQLNNAFDFFENYVKGMSESDLEKHYQMLGHDVAGYDILLHVMGESHERLASQAISLSRTIGVSPPGSRKTQETSKPQQ